MDVLEREGEQGIRVERLARELGIAKSGFYWHFRDREELLGAVIDFWEREYTSTVVLQLDAEGLEREFLKEWR